MSLMTHALNFVGKSTCSDDPTAFPFPRFIGGGIFFLNPFRRAGLRIRQIGQEEICIGIKSFTKIRDKSRPVIHLDIDVMPESAPPRGFIMSRPYSLQGSGQTAFSRRRNQKVTAVLEIKFF